LKLPSWFDDWNNIPEEKDDDDPEVKALKVCKTFFDVCSSVSTQVISYDYHLFSLILNAPPNH
jgi:hypothetical protein